MGDTQRSQTISPDSQRIAEQTVSSDVGFSGTNSDNFPVLTGQTSLEWLKVHARAEPNLVFTALTHRISFDLLKRSYGQVRRSMSCGVDGMTAEEYAVNLEANIYGLLQRLQRGQYVAQPVKRIWIDKEGGKKRPIGISALEDKIVQKAVAKILDVIYDRNFHGFSHGFREGHSQHMALHELRAQCRTQNINFVIDADVSGFFDTIDKK
ncbi:MAG: group II intron reverse transcriptase/maturase, partial [Bacteroidetes bacterium]|nr:group II intron reverse transcriptase/maturase [Bacteroidota bacterium]